MRRSAFGRAAVIAAGALAVAAACAPRDDEPIRATLQVRELLGGSDTAFARALEPRPFDFPADHGPHPEYRSEWWYFVGNLTAEDGHELGYQLTFFRSALTAQASAEASDSVSAWRARDAYMAHFAVSDIGGGRFHAAERFGRGALGLAGATAQPWRVWLGDWQLASTTSNTFPIRLRARDGDVAIDLVLEPNRPVVPNGDRGLSRKGPEHGNASYYYSLTRLATSGTVRTGGREYRVHGESWLDREWSTSALGPGVEGWDWFAIQLDDATDLMVYRLRRSDGTMDPFSGGTFVDAAGNAVQLRADDLRLTARRTWRSPLDGTAYPIAWRVEVPALDIALDVVAALEQQELNLAVRYWEGAVRVQGTRRGQRVSGRGYLEMTGAAPRER